MVLVAEEVMKIVKTWLMMIALVFGAVFLMPLSAPAITTQPASSLTTVAHGVIAYDAGTVRVVSGNTLTGAGVCGLSVPTFDPSARLVAAKNGPKVLNQFNSVDSLLQNAGTFTKLKGGVQQAIIKGDGQSIFNAISQGGQKLPSGAVKMPDGTILNTHISPKSGEFTIDINQAGQFFKIRVNP
jgi:hypothetical protein